MSSGRVGIIAGNGKLPFELADCLLESGTDVHLIGIANEIDAAVANYPHDVIEWGKISGLFAILQREGIERVVLAGGIVNRPQIKLSMLDFGILFTLPALLSAMLSGDNAILTNVMQTFEKRGFKVVSIPQVAPELLVSQGANGTAKAAKADMARVNLGLDVLRALGSFDVGQGCIAIGKRVVAIEGLEGTDGMLARIASLKASGRLSLKSGGVLVKAMKASQDVRADLPTIGPDTVRNVHAAALDGIAVQAGRTIIVEREETIDLARRLGIFIHGFDVAS